VCNAHLTILPATMPPVRGHEPHVHPPILAASQHISTPELPSRDTMPPTPRASHAKKRDASYIPRPPNAFILFRSSFIKSQRVPGNVEGNHSTLSKIIGKDSPCSLFGLCTDRTKASVGGRFQEKREKGGRRRLSLLRPNIGESIPIGGLDPVRMPFLQSLG